MTFEHVFYLIVFASLYGFCLAILAVEFSLFIRRHFQKTYKHTERILGGSAYLHASIFNFHQHKAKC